jgi:exopolyphosphatase/guanosine-5'-triphosphate,3'-diphosphate pyrophosphatase
VRVAVIDVGSNTARLLVADVEGARIVPVDRSKAFLRLGTEIERRGRLRRRKIEETADVAAGFAARAQAARAERWEALVTAPGRQTTEPETLEQALRRATGGWPVRLLTHREEGALAFEGAIALTGALPPVVAVVDVGGGSTEISLGTPAGGASWVRSLDLGSLRLTRRLLPDDPPSAHGIEHARALVARSLREVESPRPDRSLAVGGSARALGRALGPLLSADALDALADACAGRSSDRTARALGIDGDRAVTLPGGALLLAGVARALGTPLHVARGGVREGAALQLAHTAAERTAA